ncbi:MAG: hypothetical protein NEHIOOID_00129 [Holosporales bacterium]
MFVPLAAFASEGLDQLPFYEGDPAEISAPIELISPTFGERQETEWQSGSESTAQSTPFAPVDHGKFPSEADVVTVEEVTASEPAAEEMTAPDALEPEATTTQDNAVTEVSQESVPNENATNFHHIQCRAFNIDGVDYMEIPVGADGMQCGFFCLDTNRMSGIEKLNEYKKAHPVVAELIASEVFRNFMIGDFSILIEEDEKTGPAVARIHELQEKMTEENKQESDMEIAFIEGQVKGAARVYVDRYLQVFQHVPLMLMVERNVGEDHASLLDLIAAAHGYALEVYIQETRTEDGGIDPAKLTLYHSFNPSKVGLPGDFESIKLILTNFDRNPIGAERSKTEWRNHFNKLIKY